MTLSIAPETTRVQVGETELYLLQGGSGPACLVLHGIEGHEGWLAFHDALADAHTVYAPSHPGYGHTPAPDWLTSVQHQAIFYHWFLQEAGVTQVDLLGVGVGGWIAAEMAIMDASRLKHLVLVNPAGVLPRSADILDIFVMPWRQVIERGFRDAQQAAEYERIYSAAPIQEFGGIREAGRVMSMRMCFKPYMHDPALPGTLGKIRTPTQIVGSENDAIIPLECAQMFADSISDARLHVLPEAGHFAHLDQPQQLAHVVREFLSS